MFVKFTPDCEEFWTDDYAESHRRCQYGFAYQVGWMRLAVLSERPQHVPAGKKVVWHFRKTEGGLVCEKEHLLWNADEPMPADVHAPRRWSRLSVKRALAAEGKWEVARDLMRQADAYDDFLMCDYIEEGDETYLRMYPALAELVGKDRLDALLDTLQGI